MFKSGRGAGEINFASCNPCPAGKAPFASCKHIAALCYALEVMSGVRGVSVETTNQCGGGEKTSFSKKQMWSKIKIWRML